MTRVKEFPRNFSRSKYSIVFGLLGYTVDPFWSKKTVHCCPSLPPPLHAPPRPSTPPRHRDEFVHPPQFVDRSARAETETDEVNHNMQGEAAVLLERLGHSESVTAVGRKNRAGVTGAIWPPEVGNDLGGGFFSKC